MAENIINKFSKSLDQGLASLYNRDQVVDLENQYANQYGVQNTATGPASDARHMAAMNNLSNTLSNSGLGIAMGLPSELAGDIGAFGAGLVPEATAALSRGFNKENFAAIAEDIAANARGTFGTPNTATARGIYDSVFSRGIPTQTASNIGDYGTAQAAEVTPQTYSNIPELTRVMNDVNQRANDTVIRSLAEAQEYVNQNRPNMSDIAGLGDLGNPTGDSRVVSEEMGMTGTPNFGRPSMADIAGQINENLIDRGNPFNDSRVVSEEQGLVGGIPDRGRGMPGAPTGAYEMVGGTPVAVGDVLGMQQALEKSNIMDEPVNQNPFDLGMLGMLAGPAGMFTGSNALRGIGLLSNIASGRAGRAASTISRGLGSLGSRISGTMRGINPTTGRPNTQAQYEADRARSQTVGRVNNMMARKAAGKSYSQQNLDRLSAEISAGRDPNQGNTVTGFGKSGMGRDPNDVTGGEGPSGGKIVCTMMNERYGFGSFRNKIWMKFHESHGPEYQKGYHAIFLPLVKIAKGEGKINTAVRKVLEHMGRHVTADMFKIMKGKKRDTLGRIYRAIFEPACHIIGKIKSALGRG